MQFWAQCRLFSVHFTITPLLAYFLSAKYAFHPCSSAEVTALRQSHCTQTNSSHSDYAHPALNNSTAINNNALNNWYSNKLSMLLRMSCESTCLCLYLLRQLFTPLPNGQWETKAVWFWWGLCCIRQGTAQEPSQASLKCQRAWGSSGGLEPSPSHHK